MGAVHVQQGRERNVRIKSGAGGFGLLDAGQRQRACRLHVGTVGKELQTQGLGQNRCRCGRGRYRP